LRRVNLAAAVHDGEQLYIPRVGERLPADITPSTTPSNVSGGKPSRSRDSQPTSTVPLIIDVNRATADDLDRLPGIGPSTAKAIIDHRTRNGPFASVDDLLAVRGIGPATLAEIRPWVRV
ncbi:MAG: ComEA family DNA-binding protein, partial [Actinomycetota bacterium]